MQIQGWAARTKGEALQPYQFELNEPQDYQCLIKVLACGICYSDIHMINNDWYQSKYPLVPGHEVIGEIVKLGASVTHLKIGDRVGVGWQKSACLQCRDCLRGHENLCDQNEGLIVTGPGGFANYLLVDSRFAFPIPPSIETEKAGPLLCGGITVYAGLRNAGMTSGQEIGIIGIGGLGHLAVQFASKLGNRVTVFTNSQDKAEFASQLGASEVVITSKNEPLKAPSRKLNILLNTAPANLDWAAYLELLDSDGTLAFVGVPDEPLSIPLFALLMKRRRLVSSPIGSRSMIMEMLSIAADYAIRPIVEVYPLEQANQAIERVKNNYVRYRAVLSISA